MIADGNGTQPKHFCYVLGTKILNSPKGVWKNASRWYAKTCEWKWLINMAGVHEFYFTGQRAPTTTSCWTRQRGGSPCSAFVRADFAFKVEFSLGGGVPGPLLPPRKFATSKGRLSL